MEIQIEVIEQAYKILDGINKLKFEEIEFIEAGSPIKISEQMKIKFRNFGLNNGLKNTDFVRLRLWERSKNENHFGRKILLSQADSNFLEKLLDRKKKLRLNKNKQ